MKGVQPSSPPEWSRGVVSDWSPWWKPRSGHSESTLPFITWSIQHVIAQLECFWTFWNNNDVQSLPSSTWSAQISLHRSEAQMPPCGAWARQNKHLIWWELTPHECVCIVNNQTRCEASSLMCLRMHTSVVSVLVRSNASSVLYLSHD